MENNIIQSAKLNSPEYYNSVRGRAHAYLKMDFPLNHWKTEIVWRHFCESALEIPVVLPTKLTIEDLEMIEQYLHWCITSEYGVHNTLPWNEDTRALLYEAYHG